MSNDPHVNAIKRVGSEHSTIFAHPLAYDENHYGIVGENIFAHSNDLNPIPGVQWAKVRPIFSPTIAECLRMVICAFGAWAKMAKTGFRPAPGSGRKKRESFRTLFSTTRSPALGGDSPHDNRGPCEP